MPTQKVLLDWSIVRICKKKIQQAHTKSVARLVDSENWSNNIFYKKFKKQKYAQTFV